MINLSKSFSMTAKGQPQEDFGSKNAWLPSPGGHSRSIVTYNVNIFQKRQQKVWQSETEMLFQELDQMNGKHFCQWFLFVALCSFNLSVIVLMNPRVQIVA